MITDKEIGKKIIMYREPTKEEWIGIGKVSLEGILNVPLTHNGISNDNTMSLKLAEKIYVYPSCCFKLYEEQINEYQIY